MCNWTLEVRDILKILWKRGEISTICFLHVRFSCLGRDQIFTSRYAGIPDKRGQDSESQLYLKLLRLEIQDSHHGRHLESLFFDFFFLLKQNVN